jgi:hypothetical protein
LIRSSGTVFYSTASSPKKSLEGFVPHPFLSPRARRALAPARYSRATSSSRKNACYSSAGKTVDLKFATAG